MTFLIFWQMFSAVDHFKMLAWHHFAKWSGMANEKEKCTLKHDKAQNEHPPTNSLSFLQNIYWFNHICIIYISQQPYFPTMLQVTCCSSTLPDGNYEALSWFNRTGRATRGWHCPSISRIPTQRKSNPALEVELGEDDKEKWALNYKGQVRRGVSMVFSQRYREMEEIAAILQ